MEQSEDIVQPKKLVLDYSTWRCGAGGNNKLGEGKTMMKNPEGFTCCLGQFHPQIDSNVRESVLLSSMTPGSVAAYLYKARIHEAIGENILVTIEDKGKSTVWYSNSELAGTAMTINDYENTTPQEKIDLLKPLFRKAGYEIEVINQPAITEENKENTENNGHAEA